MLFFPRVAIPVRTWRPQEPRTCSATDRQTVCSINVPDYFLLRQRPSSSSSSLSLFAACPLTGKSDVNESASRFNELRLQLLVIILTAARNFFPRRIPQFRSVRDEKAFEAESSRAIQGSRIALLLPRVAQYLRE